MKKIEAIIRPEKLEDIKEALNLININGITISQVMGCGKQKGWKEFVRGKEIDLNILPKLRLEIVVSDLEQVESIVDVIVKNARTGVNGELGDGKIFIYDVCDVVRIRTGHRGVDAV